MSQDKIVLARAKAFTGCGVGTYHFSVSPDGTVRVYDHIAMHYTNCHILSRSAVRRIRNLAKSDETQQRSTIEIYVTPAGGFALTQSKTGKRWPLVALGPTDGFASKAEAEKRKSDIESGAWKDTSQRIPVGFDPFGQ